MAWENCTLEKQRFLVIEAYKQKTLSMTDICIKFVISRKTGYKWVNRFEELGNEGLKDLSKARLSSGVIYNKDQIDRAIDLKLRQRTWGPKKILKKLQDKYPYEKWPSPTRLHEIFLDYNLVTTRRLRGLEQPKRVQRKRGR